MSSLNESQRKIAETLEGMIVVDAGPGTGKTHTVVARCVNIIRQKDFGPKDLIMLTFTRNAAAEMRDRVQKTLTDMASAGEFSPDPVQNMKEHRRLTSIARQMYIGTFDSFCLSIVKQSPFRISQFFELKEELSRSSDITENESINRIYFERFLDRFLEDNGAKYGDLAAIAAEAPTEIYSLINRLMAKGILPLKNRGTARPWFGGNDGLDLIGDVKALREAMKDFKGLDKETAKKFADIPSAAGLDLTWKVPDHRVLDLAAGDDRKDLIDMVHDIYYEFVRRSVSDGHLTFGLVAGFAFVILYTDRNAREDIAAKYLIVDEFQDTNSNQLAIALMVLKEPNLCAVGDWKQGIYGFRFVSTENITDFERKVVELRRFLNQEEKRIAFQIPETIKLPLTENYRSSQMVIDKAFDSLLIQASKREDLDTDIVMSQITYIESKREDIGGNTDFVCVNCHSKESETDEVLRRILGYVGSDRYTIADGGGERKAEFRDIAVLCRSTETCRQVYEACLKHNIPAFLQGELNVMATREGKILLAWLRYISNDKDEWGIVPILADMGYSCSQIDWMVTYDREEGKDHIPPELKSFRQMLRRKRRRITELISDIFDRYGLDNDVTQAIITILSSTHRGSLMTISDIINIIENDIARNTKYDVDGLPDSNAVTIQTLHKSKGLEYPIVIIPRIDRMTFPPSQTDRSMFLFGDKEGIRCRKEIVEFSGEKKIAESWKTAVVRKSIKPDYSEERRLLFVGISRAKQYVTLIAGPLPSAFFQHYADSGREYEGEDPVPYLPSEEDELIPRPEVESFRPRRKNIPVHGLLKFDVANHLPEEDGDEFSGKGMQYGTEVHKLAELQVHGNVLGNDVLALYPQAVESQRIIDGLRAAGARLTAETDCAFPLNELNATVNGRIDMYAEFPDRIEVHDWKTDAEKIYENEYMVQLSVYAAVLREVKKKPVEAFIDWLTLGESEPVTECSRDEMLRRAKDFLTVNPDGA